MARSRWPALRWVAPLALLALACSRGPEPIAAPILQLEVPVHAATTPAAHTGWRVKRFEKIMRRVERGDVDIAFLGDSLTHKWNKEGKPVWETHYAKRPDPRGETLEIANFGVGGDRTQHVLWRIEQGNFDGLNPRLVVLLIGTNNLRHDSPRATADGVIAVLQQLVTRLPDTRILLLGLFPRGASPDDPARELIRQTNRFLAELDDGERIHFLDIGAAFLDDQGAIPLEVMYDSLHLTEAGYEIWARAMEPELSALIDRE